MDGRELMHPGNKPSADGNTKTGLTMLFGLCSSAPSAP